MTYEPAWFESPLHLPEARSGKMKIRHRVLPVGSEVPIVGMRQAMLRGVRPVSAVLEKPLRIHELEEDGVGVWMSDRPEELNQIAQMLRQVNPRGRVLVGGLGLGILAKTLAQRSGVKDVFVVERSADVIKLCKASGYRVQEDDIAAFLRWHAEPFDYYLLDTWQGTNESAWWEDVLPLRRILRRRFGRKPVIHCWAEDIMAGQIVRTLTTTEPHWYYKALPLPLSTRDANKFVRDVGLPAWERNFGAAVDITVPRTADLHF